MKRNDFFHYWYNWYAIVTPLWIFGVLFNEFICWRKWGPQDFAAWAGAAGTFLAFGGTIYLARAETRQREEVDYARKILIIEGMLDDIRMWRFRIQAIAKALVKLGERETYDSRPYRNVQERLMQFPEWSDEQLLPLLVVDLHVGWRLKRIRGNVLEAARFIDSGADQMDGGVEFDDITEFLNAVLNLNGVGRELETIHKQFKAELPDF